MGRAECRKECFESGRGWEVETGVEGFGVLKGVRVTIEHWLFLEERGR